MLKRTPLYAAHQRWGGRLVEFGGWEMPVQYTGIVEEHLTVRSSAGLFDISHMGEVRVKGPEAAAFLNRNLTNQIEVLGIGDGQYSLLCNEAGGVVDDLYVFRFGEQEFFLIINASRIGDDVNWLQSRLALWGKPGTVQLVNQSDDYGAVALQGPAAVKIIDQLTAGAATQGKPVTAPSALAKHQIAVFPGRFSDALIVSRTGYTGEDGFEIAVPAAGTEALWEKTLELGRPHGLKPAGLGARDTLRTEMGYSLYGHELDEKTTPLEAGLGFFVNLQKADFTGKATLVRQKQEGLARRCVAFRMVDRCPPPRPHYPVFASAEGGQAVGEVTSGTQSPSLNVGIGMAYVAPAQAALGGTLCIEIRGKRYAATVAKRPLYQPKAA